jgi:hypothetical protein
MGRHEDVPKSVRGGFVRVFWKGRFRCEKLGIGDHSTSVAFDRNGSALAVGDESGDVFVLSSSCGLPRKLLGGGRPAVGVAWGPDRVAAVDHGGTLRWWDLTSSDPVAEVVMTIH